MFSFGHVLIDIGVTQQRLNGSDTVSALQQMCRKTMPESVAAGIFVNACLPDSVFYGRLNPAPVLGSLLNLEKNKKTPINLTGNVKIMGVFFSDIFFCL